MRCISLFSGCGGLDLGLRDSGFEIVLATDNNALCGESHQANFPETTFQLASIENLDERCLAPALVEGTIDLLAGGPPCPPYSKSRFYRPDKPRALNDPVGDASLSGFLRILAIAEPRAFLLENVAGLGFGVHKEALNLILSTAESLGYICSHGRLNAADYGVPQIRERYFVIGSREGRIAFPSPTHAKAGSEDRLPTEELPAWRTAGEVMLDIDTPENASDEGHFAGGQYHHLLCKIPPGDNYLFLTAKRGHPDPKFEWRKRYWSFLLKLSPELPSWTIQARRSNNMGPFHWRNRILRIAEIKRLQSFPDNWFLAGRVEDQWRQVGNAVPPLLAANLGRAIRMHLLAEEAA
ncbi:MAG: DNA cytosine methyltransferase [Actinomycetota bacterium]